jgi:hypothetical protein
MLEQNTPVDGLSKETRRLPRWTVWFEDSTASFLPYEGPAEGGAGPPITEGWAAPMLG